MAEPQFKFDDGAAYERMMGIWSRIAGSIFLDWLAPGRGLKWVDIGCGNGAFTELIVERCAPKEVNGIDPSAGQLAYARTRPAARLADFSEGDAMALPFADDSFDIAVMALVLFFVPDPKKGVAEMVRVVKPGGTAAVYLWDMLGGGFPNDPILTEMRGMGIEVPLPPSANVSRMQALIDLWTEFGFLNIASTEIAVTRDYSSFEDYWAISQLSSSVAPKVAKMTDQERAELKRRLHARMSPDAHGRIRASGRANAIKGKVPR